MLEVWNVQGLWDDEEECYSQSEGHRLKEKKLFLEYSAVMTVSLLRGRSAGSFPEQQLVIESIDLVVYKKLTDAI